MGKQQLSESQIGITLGMHPGGVSQRAIARSQVVVHKPLKRHDITTFKKTRFSS